MLVVLEQMKELVLNLGFPDDLSMTQRMIYLGKYQAPGYQDDEQDQDDDDVEKHDVHETTQEEEEEDDHDDDENKDKKNRLMRIDELHKFSDGTLDDVRTVLNDRLKGIRMEYLPETFWSHRDKANARAMIQARHGLKTGDNEEFGVTMIQPKPVDTRISTVDIEKVALAPASDHNNQSALLNHQSEFIHNEEGILLELTSDSHGQSSRIESYSYRNLGTRTKPYSSPALLLTCFSAGYENGGGGPDCSASS
ncbi:hypothetical protein Tco_0158428 [Tanacetum coccineum]